MQHFSYHNHFYSLWIALVEWSWKLRMREWLFHSSVHCFVFTYSLNFLLHIIFGMNFNFNWKGSLIFFWDSCSEIIFYDYAFSIQKISFIYKWMGEMMETLTHTHTADTMTVCKNRMHLQSLFIWLLHLVVNLSLQYCNRDSSFSLQSQFQWVRVFYISRTFMTHIEVKLDDNDRGIFSVQIMKLHHFRKLNFHS